MRQLLSQSDWVLNKNRERYQGPTSTEGQTREQAARGENLREKPHLPTPRSWTATSRTVRTFLSPSTPSAELGYGSPSKQTLTQVLHQAVSHVLITDITHRRHLKGMSYMDGRRDEWKGAVTKPRTTHGDSPATFLLATREHTPSFAHLFFL